MNSNNNDEYKKNESCKKGKTFIIANGVLSRTKKTT